MKRILSIVLAVMMLVGCMSISVMAAEETQVEPLSLKVAITNRNFTVNRAVAAGSKVMFANIAAEEGYTVKYYNNGVEVTPEAAPVGTFIMFPINAGDNVFTAKLFQGETEVAGSESNELYLYGVTYTSTAKDARTDKISADKTEALKTVITENADEAAVATAKAVLEYDETTGTYGRTATVHQANQTGGGKGARMEAYYSTVPAGEGIDNEVFEVFEISRDVFFTESTLASAYSLTGGKLGYELDSTAIKSGNSYPSFYKVDTDLSLTVNNKKTDFKFKAGQWYTVRSIYNTIENNVDVYVDDVLIVKGIGSGVNYDNLRMRILTSYSASANSQVYLSNITFDATMKYEGRKTLSIAADDTTDTVTVTAVGLTDEEVYLYENGVKAAAPLTFTEGVATATVEGYAEVYAAVTDAEGNVVETGFGEELKTDVVAMTGEATTEIVIGAEITETGAGLGIIKANLPAEDQEKQITVFAIANDGSIESQSITFGAADTFKSVSFNKAGIEKMFVWKLAEMKSIVAPISK